MGDITHTHGTGGRRVGAGALGGFAGALAVAASAYAYSIFGASEDSAFLSVGARPVRQTATPVARAVPVAASATAGTPEAALPPAVVVPFTEATPASVTPPAVVVAQAGVAASSAAPVAATAPPAIAQAPVVSAPAPPPPVVATSVPAPAVAVVPLNAREQGLVDAMNVRRAAAGLPSLGASGALTGIARARSSDMLSKNYFSHSSPTGETWYSLLASQSMTFSAGGENLAKVYGDAPTSVNVAIEALMASPTHRANILNPAYRLVGVGSASTGDTVTILTTVFTDR